MGLDVPVHPLRHHDDPAAARGGFRFLVGGAARPDRARRRRAARFPDDVAAVRTTALSGLLLPAWGNGLVTVAQQHVASGLAALLIARAALHRDVPGRHRGPAAGATTVAGVAIGAVGLALLVLVGPAGGSAGVVGSAWWGPWLVLLAGSVGRRDVRDDPPAVPPNPFALAATQMLIGGVILPGVGLAMGDRLDPAGIAPASAGPWATWRSWTLGCVQRVRLRVGEPAGVDGRHLRLRQPGHRRGPRRLRGGGAVHGPPAGGRRGGAARGGAGRLGGAAARKRPSRKCQSGVAASGV